jgi:hypothetical protein
MLYIKISGRWVFYLLGAKIFVNGSSTTNVYKSAVRAKEIIYVNLKWVQ